MVGGSELAFRLLARRHGAQLCYTPMIRSEEFAVPLLERHADDCPLVAHFSGNDPQTLLDAARQAERCRGVVAVDLNLGCPQRAARSGRFGAFLCDAADRALLLRIVSTLSRSLCVPLFCKAEDSQPQPSPPHPHTLPNRRFAAVPPRLTQIRLLDEIDETLAFAQQLQDAGCALLAVHGRYRGSPMRRRDGPAHLDQVALIKQRLSVPVVTNGNVRSGAELVDSLLLTGADGAMTAEGALDDPAIFAKAIAHAHAERSRLAAERRRAKALKAQRRDGRHLTEEEAAVVRGRKAAKATLAQIKAISSALPPPPSAAPPPPFALAEQYIGLVEEHPPPGGAAALLSHAVFHLRRLCRTPLAEFGLLADLEACKSLAACADVIRRCRAFAEGSEAFQGRRRPPSYWRRQQRRKKM